MKNLSADKIVISAREIPAFRTAVAKEKGLLGKLLFKTWGGLGDQICAEPTLRYALGNFKDCEISLASEHPDLFSHLKFSEVFDLRKVRPVEENYFVFETICEPSRLPWQFFSHLLVHCVDFPSMCALRMQLPIEDREILLHPEFPERWKGSFGEILNNAVFIHPGRHWPSKSFPKDWWDAVIQAVVAKGGKPVIIGGDSDDNRGTVDVAIDSVTMLDLRNQLSIPESIWFLQHAKVLLTNDSAPLHMAASGDAWIGFIATCKHPDYITHWRGGEFGWRMQNHGKGGIWDLAHYCPNKEETVLVDQIEESILRTWLPNPDAYAQWAVNRL